ncbi:sensor histidine kinase [Aeromicrobium sp.]|uniref:sensor histidine kinase n=1 Tax=Aeromicrobium sp. TaxID=1871063 RepID=UPI003D6A17DB
MRITIAAAALATVAIAVAATILVTTLRASLIDTADMSSKTRASELNAAAARGLLTDVIANIAEEGVGQVVADDGKVLAASENVRGAARISQVVPPRGEPEKLIIRNAPDDDETEDYRVWAVRGDGVTAYVGTSLEDEREVIFDLTRLMIIGLPLLVAVFAAGTWLMVGRTLRPVEDIRAEVASISHRRLDRRVPLPPTNDEIGRLARTMNEMLGRLEASSERQREFVGNASHELRSPLAAFRAQLEVASAHPAGVDWPSLAEDLLKDSNRMENMVQDLLFLAREDAAATPPSTPVDLDDVVLEEVARVRSTASVAVHAEGVSAAPVLGRREDLARLVRNLLDNASAYASSRIDVSLSAENGRVELAVADDGPGVAPEDRPRIFERFYRADPVRNPQNGGTGLGLAIVEAVAKSHGGTIAVADGTTGARFEVSLPTLRSERPAATVPVPS